MIDELRRRVVVVADHLTFHACWLTEGYTAGDLLYLGRIVGDPDATEDAVWLPERVMLERILVRQGWRRMLRMCTWPYETPEFEVEVVLVPPPEAVSASERCKALEPDDCLQCWLEGRYDDADEDEDD